MNTCYRFPQYVLNQINPKRMLIKHTNGKYPSGHSFKQLNRNYLYNKCKNNTLLYNNLGKIITSGTNMTGI